MINVSSAAQAPVDVKALAGETQLTDHEAYAQSKLAMIAWSRHLAQSLNGNGPAIVSINPGSMLASTDGERGLRGAWPGHPNRRQDPRASRTIRRIRGHVRRPTSTTIRSALARPIRTRWMLEEPRLS